MDNIWILNHYANINNGRHPSLASHFVNKGYKSCIFLSSFDHSKRKYLYEDKIKVVQNEDGVKYVYIHSNPAYKNNGIGRILNMISFCLLISKNINTITEQVGVPNYIIASSVHPFVWEIGYKIAKKYKSKFIAEIRDIWPLSLIEVTNVSPNHPFVKLLGWIERRAYLRSNAIVTTMPFAYEYICSNFPIKKEKVHWMPNGVDVTQYEKNILCNTEIPKNLNDFLSNHWCCVYTGSFVESECLPMMLDAFSILKDKDIYFAIIGDGHDKAELIKQKERLGLDKVVFFPFVPQYMVAKILSKAKCCVAASRNLPIYRYGVSVNKISDYLLSGKPVVYACDYHNVVKDVGQFSIPGESSDIFAQTVLKIKEKDEKEFFSLGEISKKRIREVYDYEIVASNYLKMLESLNDKIG